MLITLLFGSLDALSIIGYAPKHAHKAFMQSLPLYSAHASWLLPCLIAIMVNAGLSAVNDQKGSKAFTRQSA